MKYKFIKSIVFNILVWTNFTYAMEKNYIERPNPEAKNKFQESEIHASTNQPILSLQKLKKLGVMWSIGLCGGCISQVLGSSPEVGFVLGLTAAGTSSLFYELAAPYDDPSFYLKKLEKCSMLLTGCLSYLAANQCGIDELPAICVAGSTGIAFDYLGWPLIEKHLYELHPEAVIRIKKIDQDLEKIQKEKIELEKIINEGSKKKLIRTKKNIGNKVGKLRESKNNSQVMTVSELRKKLHNDKEENARIEEETKHEEEKKLQRIAARNKAKLQRDLLEEEEILLNSEKAELQKQKISMIDETIKAYFGPKKKTKGQAYKNGKGLAPKGIATTENAVEDLEDSLEKIEITESLKRDLMKYNIHGLFTHHIELDDLKNILRRVGFGKAGTTGSHQQFRYAKLKRIPLVSHGNTQNAYDYQRQKAIERLQSLGITEEEVRSWYQNW